MVNPIASVIAFDIFKHNYTSLAIRQLRNMCVTASDFASSAMLHKVYPSLKCNLVFIDGGHQREQLFADIKCFQLLANGSYDIQDELLQQSLHIIQY